MKNILAIETATNACSVALNSEQKVITRFEVGNNLHSTVLLEMVSSVLNEMNISVSDLDGIAVGQGPGSFTGLRIGIGVAQGLAYGAQCRMLGVSSLLVLAQETLLSTNVKDFDVLLSGIDARMNEIYFSSYIISNGLLIQQGEIHVLPPKKILHEEFSHAKKICMVGNAWEVYRSELPSTLVEQAAIVKEIVYPRAEFILGLATEKNFSDNSVLPQHFSPNYVRNNVAHKPRPK